MKNNQKGAIDLMLAVTLVAVLTVGAFVVYRVSDTSVAKRDSSNQTENTQNDTNDTAEDTPADGEIVVEECSEETKSQIPYTLTVPEKWTRTPECFTRDGSTMWSEVITSDDYVSTDDDPNDDYALSGATMKGAKIYVTIESPRLTGAGSRVTVESILAGTAQLKGTPSEVREVKVGDLRGVEFITAYEGPGIMVTQFDVGDDVYTISIEEDVNGPAFNDHLDEYRALVKSLRIK